MFWIQHEICLNVWVFHLILVLKNSCVIGISLLFNSHFPSVSLKEKYGVIILVHIKTQNSFKRFTDHKWHMNPDHLGWRQACYYWASSPTLKLNKRNKYVFFPNIIGINIMTSFNWCVWQWMSHIIINLYTKNVKLYKVKLTKHVYKWSACHINIFIMYVI